MPSFDWGLHPDAASELDASATVYGPRFRQEMHQWLFCVANSPLKIRSF
jgi:hypothetical protein